MAELGPVKEALLDALQAAVPDANCRELLYLAEAYAWIVSPNQPHGVAPPPPNR
jgi:hypothetical protein